MILDESQSREQPVDSRWVYTVADARVHIDDHVSEEIQTPSDMDTLFPQDHLQHKIIKPN